MQLLRYSPRHQSGIVLIVSFIILLLLTIIGISGMKVTGLEEKMAGNDRDQNVAFQAAEAALRAGEAKVLALWDKGNGSINKTFCANVAGLYHGADLCAAAPKATAPNSFDTTVWTDDTKSIAVTSISNTVGNKLVAAAPRYFITYAAKIAPLTGDNNPPTYLFIVTARGVGGQEGSQVVLRSHFGGLASFAD